MNSYSITYWLTYNEESDAYVKFASFGARLWMFSNRNYELVRNIKLEFMHPLSGVEMSTFRFFRNDMLIVFQGCWFEIVDISAVYGTKQISKYC